MSKKDRPAFFYGPDGQSRIFEEGEDPPAGWEDHPSKVKDAPKAEPKPRAARKTKAKAAKPARTAEPKAEAAPDGGGDAGEE